MTTEDTENTETKIARMTASKTIVATHSPEPA